jgi:transcriptional regulator with XRE-family HTH domain
MKLFGNTVKFLLAQRGLTAKELAERVNLSETSISKIVKGVTKPRQANLTRILQELCKTPEEEQQLLSAYDQMEDGADEDLKPLSLEVFEQVEEDRVRSYLQAKSLSIAFRESVAAALTDAGIDFQGPHQNQDIICDFFIPGTQSIALECKSNPTRDWDRTITSARLFREELPCDRVIVVTPFEESELTEPLLKRLKKAKVQIVPHAHLGEYFRTHVSND